MPDTAEMAMSPHPIVQHSM